MKLKNVPYKHDFYWQGNRYVQFIRPKVNPKGKFEITCYLKTDPCREYIDMPAGREVKPVLTLSEYKHTKR